MRKIVALVSIGALAACSQAEEAAPVVEEEPVEEVVEAVPGSVAPGSYTVANADGEEAPFSIDADGNWTGVDDDGNPESGTSEVVDGKICFTTEGETESRCWLNEAPGKDGAFSSTSDDGDTVTVTPAATEG